MAHQFYFNPYILDNLPAPASGFDVVQDFGGSLEVLRLIGITDLQIVQYSLSVTSHGEYLLSNTEDNAPPWNQNDKNIVQGILQDCKRNPALTMFF